jgi:hypothetical protein
MEYKSSYEILRERLEREKRISVMSEQEAFELAEKLNREMAIGEVTIKLNEIEAKKELANIILNA